MATDASVAEKRLLGTITRSMLGPEMKPSRLLPLVLLMAAETALWAAPSNEYELDEPPRLQWNANSGYCGETSFISAGLYYGQYCSQYTARSIASPGVPQSNPDSQLLLGNNDVSTAVAMRLAASPWNGTARTPTKNFLAWTKSHLLSGHPVIIGVFTNEYRFSGTLKPKAGDADYDHIVPVVAVGSDRALEPNADRYFASDVLTFSDNGLWNPSGTPAYLFSYRFAEIQRNRRQANGPRKPIYSLKDNGRNYGIAITGVVDEAGVTIPVRLTTSRNDEVPAMVNGLNTPPAPMPLSITATVTVPDQSVAYKVYRYDKFNDVPVSSFNAQAGKAVETWTIPAGQGPTFQIKKSIESDDIVIFRAVRASAP
jgi:hypothetical protein